MQKELSTFRDKVLSIVAGIPRGKTMSYAQVVQSAGSPGAVRAVCTIMRNNYEGAIPCHRVIRSDGKPGEYNRGGEVAKRKLLESEGAL